MRSSGGTLRGPRGGVYHLSATGKRVGGPAPTPTLGVRTLHLDEGPRGWKAGPSDLTRLDTGILPPSKLLHLPGRKGEHELFAKSPTGRYTSVEWKKFVADVKKRGVKHPVTIHKDADGKVWVHEGNHRLRAAAEAGVPVPVEVSYFGNSQRSGVAL